MLSERYSSRAWPLNIGLILLIGSQIMLMLAPVYWVMCIARVLQGFASSTVWVVGLALVCDLTPKRFIGKQLGIVMAGFSLGLLLGPTIGGALYTRFGYHGPFIFGIICAAVDLFFRLLIVERKDALKWGVDPCADPSAPSTEDPEQNSEQKTATLNTGIPVEGGTVVEDGTDQAKHTSFLKVVLRMGRSPRAQAALFLTALEAFVLSAQEPAITLHVADIWGLNPTQVGLVFLAFSIPAMISAPISGWLCDVRGAEWVTAIGLLLAIPWETLIILESSLVLFLVSLAIGCTVDLHSVRKK
jgi:MFS family permease